jgi:PadR family transcriptional regulator PadR
MENKIKQLRKGILELAILASLDHESRYGYSLIKAIASRNGILIAEGTIYPILRRLLKEGLIQAKWEESNQGPPRKYYSLTGEGKKAFDILKTEFDRLKNMVSSLNIKKGATEKG